MDPRAPHRGAASREDRLPDAPRPSRRSGSAPDADVASLDDSAVDNLHRLGGDKLVRQMVELFESLVPSRLSTIRAALERADAESVQLEAHALKSSAGNVGATRMRELCQRLESLATSGDLSVASDLAHALEEEFNQIAPRLRSRVEGQAA